jgi:hypothetical protein
LKVLWVSPTGSGLSVAQRVKAAGHQVVTYGTGEDMPTIDTPHLFTFAKAADLVIVDGPFPLTPNKRSLMPARDALFFDEVRRNHDIVALGPTPTVDLLVGDRRYFRKWCDRLSIPYARDAAGDWTSGAWFRANDIVPPGPYLESWKPLFKAVNFRGWFELKGEMTAGGPVVSSCSAVWTPETIPAGREADFLLEMSR